MNRYKNYTDKLYKKGYEVHNNKNQREIKVGNNKQHIKWKDGKSSGHIFYKKPN
jgi:tRNA splicing ligase